MQQSPVAQAILHPHLTRSHDPFSVPPDRSVLRSTPKQPLTADTLFPRYRSPKVVPPFAVRATRAPVPRPAMPEDPMAAKRREIMAAIRKGDLAALKRALPSCRKARRAAQQLGVEVGARAGSPAIARQVREWDPEWVAGFTASASQNLTVAARGWWSDDSAARRGYPVRERRGGPAARARRERVIAHRACVRSVG
jgi:hypothetical protein